jgi:transposase
MFLKKSHSKNKTYYSIAETYREDGKVKHRILAYLGSLDTLNKQQYRNLALSLLKAVDAEDIIISQPDDLQELTRLNWGINAVYRALWDYFELDDLLETIWKQRVFEFNATEAIFLMLLDRLSAPCSKLKTFEDQAKYFDLKAVSLQHLYRSLDLLADSKEEIETALFHKNRTLFNLSVDVVFYDVTTFYFESQKENDIKGFGFSKDHKNNEVQVVMGLLMDKEGRPVGFDIYPGNTFEGNTVETALDKLKERFQIGKVIWVSDRGFCSAKTFEALKKRQYDYIIGAKLKTMSVKMQSQIQDMESYQVLQEDEELIRYKILEIEPASKETEKQDRIICTWSSKRAKKDKADRERLLEKARELVENPAKVAVKRGTRKYLKTTTTTTGLDEDKIKADAAWDGIYGIRTNNATMTPMEIRDAYSQLWRIEECFRVLKANLETRPVYHWSENRIKGHFVLCFIAFLLERTLEIKLREAKVDYSVRKIRESLNKLELSIVKIKDSQYLLRADPDELGGNILKILKIKKLKRFEPIVV